MDARVAAATPVVVAPVGEAEPAELVAALPASHVVAALILLDVALALRAGLCVRLDPVDVRVLILLLRFPRNDLCTVAGLVVLLRAKNAVAPAALAINAVD